MKRTTFHSGNEDRVYVESARISAAIKNSMRAKGRLRFTSNPYAIMFSGIRSELKFYDSNLARKRIYIDGKGK